MKHPFVKSVLVLGAALALWNCGDEAASMMPTPGNGNEAFVPSENSPIVSGTSAADIVVSEPCWIMTADQLYVITTKLEVFNASGVKIGAYDPITSVIVDANGTVLMEGVKYQELPIIDPGSYDTPSTNPGTTVPPTGTTPVSSASNGGQTQPNVPVSSASNGGQTQPNVPASSASNGGQTQPNVPASSASNGGQTQPNVPASSASNGGSQQGSDGTCFDKVSNKNVKPYESLVGKNGEAYAYAQDCSLNCYYDPTNKNCASIGTSTGSNNNQQQQQPQSSASQPKSSSSVARSSSSVARSSSSVARSSSSVVRSSSSQQQQQQGGSLLPKVIGSQTKSGYATRYWDSCKPHCAWEGKGGPVARTCKTDGVTQAGSGESSVCNGGSAGTCFDQTPQIVNDTIAYAFAATPGGGNDCGKCYMLTFKGTGASATGTPTDSHHKKIKGKHLIVMSSNIGYDVNHNQFDLMIPGGGPGEYNGCGKMGISCAGAQYGGFLTTCNYKKDCLINMCNQEYGNNTSLKNGCLFLANWMDAANNPEVDFVEVECPQALKDKY